MLMFRHTLRLLAACGLLAFVAAQADAVSGVKGGGNRGGKHRSTKPTDPLEAAVKDLREAEKELGSKEGSKAGKLTRSAQQIVGNQLTLTRQARDRAADGGTATKEQREHIKARVSALDAVVKDIKTAEKEIAAKKADDAKTAIQSAITALEGLTGGEKKKKK
jgi:hypothetical protein